MKRAPGWLKTSYEQILGLAVIAVCLILLIHITPPIWRVYVGLSETAKVAAFIALTSLIGTLWTLRSTRIKERMLQLEAEHVRQKKKIYTDFIKGLFLLISDPEKASDEDFSSAFRQRFMSQAILWSGNRVLQNYYALRLVAQSTDDELANMRSIATLILSFRDDLGLSNKNLNEDTILGIIYDQSQIAQYMEQRIAQLLSAEEPAQNSKNKKK